MFTPLKYSPVCVLTNHEKKPAVAWMVCQVNCVDQPSHVPPHLPSFSPVCQEHQCGLCLSNNDGDVKKVVMTSNFILT